MSTIHPKVDKVIRQDKRWRKEFELLRTIVLGFPLTETLKWGQPCYTLNATNVVLIHGFKEYCALLFFKGALLKDPDRILATPGQHQAARQIRFRDVREITRLKAVVKAYVQEAIDVEKAGRTVKLKKTSDFEFPVEFQKKLAEMPRLKAAFDALTPGRQRGYLFCFSQPKQSKTRTARIEKYVKCILQGKGLTD